MATADDPEFYVLLRITRDKDGLAVGQEFVSARKTRPEDGLLRALSSSEAWIKVRAYVPTSVFLGSSRHDPIGCWGEHVYPSAPSELLLGESKHESAP